MTRRNTLGPERTRTRGKRGSIRETKAYTSKASAYARSKEQAAYLAELDRSLVKVEQSIRDKSWPIEPHERVY